MKQTTLPSDDPRVKLAEQRAIQAGFNLENLTYLHSEFTDCGLCTAHVYRKHAGGQTLIIQLLGMGENIGKRGSS